MKTDENSSTYESAGAGAILVEDLTAQEDQEPERVRIRLDEMDVVIAVEARATSGNQLVASCDLPFLRLGSGLRLQRPAREKGTQRGRLGWIALDMSDDSCTPRIRLGLDLEPVGTEDNLAALPFQHLERDLDPDRGRDLGEDLPKPPPEQEAEQQEAPPEPALDTKQDRGQDEHKSSRPDRRQKPTQPPGRSTVRRWLGRLALVALGMAGSALLARQGTGSSGSNISATMLLPLPPQIVVAPTRVPAEILAAAPSAVASAALALTPAAAVMSPRISRKEHAGGVRKKASVKRRTARARRAKSRRARLKRNRAKGYLARAQAAMKRRRPKRARHLARLVLLLDPKNRSAAAILGKRTRRAN